MNAEDLALIRSFIERYGFLDRRPVHYAFNFAWGLIRLHREEAHRLHVSLVWGLAEFTLEREFGAWYATASARDRMRVLETAARETAVTTLATAGGKPLRGGLGQAS